MAYGLPLLYSDGDVLVAGLGPFWMVRQILQP